MHSRFDTEARIAVAQAADIARELGHREVGPDHLLLGLLANPRGTAYATLTDHGLRLDAAREIVAAHHVDPVDEPGAGSEPDATQPTSYDADRDALRAIGIDLDRVREAVRDNLGADLSEGWASRPERGRRRGRGRGRGRGESRGRAEGLGHHHHGHHHRSDSEDLEGRGRRGPRSRRGEGPRFSRELRSLLHDVRRSSREQDLADPLSARGAEEASEADFRGERSRREGPGLTGARLLVALTRSEDEVVRSVLAAAIDLDGLQQRAEAAAGATA